VFVAGLTNGTSQWDAHTLTPSSSFLAHLDGLGQVDWLKSWSSSGAAVGASAALPAGGVTITGQLVGATDFGNGPHAGVGGDLDAFVATYDRSGALSSFAQYGDEYAQWGSAIATNELGDTALVVTGYGTANFDDGVTTQANWIVEFDAARAATGVVSRFPSASPLVAIDSDGRVIAAGVLGGPTDFGNGAIGLQQGEFEQVTQFFVLSYDAAGKLRWSKSFLGDVAQPVALPNGDIVLAGPTISGKSDLGCGAAAPGATVFVADLDSEGNCRWSQGLSYADEAFVTADGAGGLVVVGRAAGVVSDSRGPLAGNGSLYFERFAADGTPLGGQQFGGVEEGQAVVISSVAASEASLWLAGTFSGSFDLLGQTLEAAPSNIEGFVARLAF
jgi:hypothetical protein